MKVIILAGFLGSGKTSVLLPLVKELVIQSKQVAIIENEVGDIGIDGSYLESEGLQVQELFGGCICCTLTVGLIESIEKLASLYHPDIIVVEATGMARPGDLKNTIRKYADLIDTVDTITVVDAERYQVLRNGLAPLFEAQIEAADTLLLNKIDTVETIKIEEAVSDLQLINNRADLFQVSIADDIGFDRFLKGYL